MHPALLLILLSFVSLPPGFKPLVFTWNVFDYPSCHVFIPSFVNIADVVCLGASPDQVKLTLGALAILNGQGGPASLPGSLTHVPVCGSHLLDGCVDGCVYVTLSPCLPSPS